MAEGDLTLDEFMSLLSDEDMARLLGGQPNRGVANTFGFGNLPTYGVPNVMTADGPAGLAHQAGMRRDDDGFPVCDAAGLHVEHGDRARDRAAAHVRCMKTASAYG